MGNNKTFIKTLKETLHFVRLLNTLLSLRLSWILGCWDCLEQMSSTPIYRCFHLLIGSFQIYIHSWLFQNYLLYSISITSFYMFLECSIMSQISIDILVSSIVFQNIPQPSRVFHLVLEYSRIFRHLQHSSIVFHNVLESSRSFQNMLTSSRQ